MSQQGRWHLMLTSVGLWLMTLNHQQQQEVARHRSSRYRQLMKRDTQTTRTLTLQDIMAKDGLPVMGLYLLSGPEATLCCLMTTCLVFSGLNWWLLVCTAEQPSLSWDKRTGKRHYPCKTVHSASSRLFYITPMISNQEISESRLLLSDSWSLGFVFFLCSFMIHFSYLIELSALHFQRIKTASVSAPLIVWVAWIVYYFLTIYS